MSASLWLPGLQPSLLRREYLQILRKEKEALSFRPPQDSLS